MIKHFTIGFFLIAVSAGFLQGQDQDGKIAGFTCNACHSEQGWSPLRSDMSFSHDKTAFPLEGRHTSLQCTQCHTGETYTEIHNFGSVDPECVSCHTDIHEGELGTDCQRCHSPTSWIEARTTFNHDETQFPLVGVHKAVDCQSCHDLTNPRSLAETPLTCYGCHIDDYNSAKEPDHRASGFPMTCEDCHAVDDVNWNQSDFDHAQTGFPLEQAHTQVQCSDCHSGPNYSTPGRECISCHQANYQSAAVNHESAEFSTNCTSCHNLTTWSDVTWDHAVETDYPLEGEHISVACLDCHVNNNFNTENTCNACHDPADYPDIVDHQKAFESYSSCEDCHPGPEGWTPTEWVHETETGYPLTGSHISATCLNCHVDNNFNVSSTCYSCHQQEYESTRGTENDHIAQNFPTTCEACHNTIAWDEATFDHDATNFPLTGAHIQAACVDCHSSGVYSGLATDCASCHIDQYNNVVNPPHADAGFQAENCETCHTTDSFSPATWNHSQETIFTIDGAHVSLSCNSCHDGTFIDYQPDGTTECVTCHRAEYENESVHAQEGFGTNCLECHNTTTFSDAEFNHDDPYFPIYSGKHQGLWGNQCSTCHTDINDRTVFTCLSSGCHANSSELQQQHQEEGVSGYVYESNACYTCHPTGNADDSFNHATTGFPLEGQHQVISCNQCHLNGDFQTPLDANCVSCHQDNYNQAANPDHGDAGFSTDCLLCHTAETFATSTWDHANETGFHLTAGHASPTCNDCHNLIGYNPSDVSCVSCHQNDYDQTTNPVHTDANFSTNCTQCHTTENFTAATWNHSAETGFALTGGHSISSCNTCHDLISYTPSDVSCVSCHLDDYNATTDPNHSSAGFPTTCEDCHNSTSDWGDAEFDHDQLYFPIYSGRHEGEWTTCTAECHVVPDNYANFSCGLNGICHEHDESRMINQHDEVSGFTYNAQECYSCHPDGRAEDKMLPPNIINKKHRLEKLENNQVQ